LTHSSLIILHTNDVHGRVGDLARIATMAQQIRAEHPETPVRCLDLGDVEEPSQRLSNVTKGAGMHRLLNAAGCDWEFESYGGYTDASWGLRPQYDVPIILREALEEYLAAHSPIRGTAGRLG